MDEPEAYQHGWVPFLGAKIFLDSRPLIPRTETEWWVEQLISQIKGSEGAVMRGAPQGDGPRTEQFRSNEIEYPKHTASSPITFLDLFAGSGCCGVAVLKNVPNARVDFAELETRHLPTIQKNIRGNADPSRAQVYQSNVYDGLPAETRYDYILANPPYLSQSRIERIEDSVLHHEPREALFAEDDGFALIARAIAGATEHLAPHGQLWIEHEPEHSQRIRECAATQGMSATTHTDQYGVERYSVILMA